MPNFTNGIMKNSDSQDDVSSSAIPCYFPQFKTERCNDEAATITVMLEQAAMLQELLLKDANALPAALKTAWALVVGCYTGQDEISFGYREMQNHESVSISHTTHIFLEKSKPIMHIIENLCSENIIGNTLTKGQFNTALTLQRSSVRNDGKVRTALSNSSCEVGLDKFALHLEVYVSDTESGAFLHWWCPQMSVDQASNVASTLDAVLGQILITPQVLLSEIQYLGKRNLEQILDWNSEPLVEDARCIHEVIRNHAVGRPSAEAICCGNTIMSYHELHRLSDQLALYLRSHGVVSGSFVPLCFDKSVWNVVSMLGVMKSGAAFVPLDPSTPVSRLQNLVARVDADLVLCSPRLVAGLQQVANEIVAVDADIFSHLPEPGNDQLPSVKSTDVAYLIWTSGTTGEPKGTMIEHGAYCSGAKDHGPAMGMSSQSRVLQFAAHVFDASLVEILTTLMLGAVVCIPTEDQRLNDITSCIRQLRVNWAVLTPSFIGFIEPVDVPELKTLVLAGEAMSESHVIKWSHIRLVNGYGPSECSVASVVNSQVTRETSPTNIGRATGVHLWVTEPENHEHLVPVGCVGELLIQGPTLARGYFKDYTKTSSSFIQQVSWTPRGWKIYKSGDLVRLCSDGSLEFVGRKDTQVKVHGQRVELGEIEHHLNVDPDVKHGLVMLPKNGPFRDRLIAVLSLKEGSADSATVQDLQPVNGLSEVRAKLNERISARLPPYMVPTMLMVVAKVPLLASGKLDRRRVMIWVEDMSEDLYRSIVDDASTGEPVHDTEPVQRTEMEDRLLAVWSHVLNLHVSQIDPYRSFLSLGGDSISAMLVKSRCAKNGIGLAVQDILRKPIVELANCTSALTRQTSYEEHTEVIFNLSPIQKLYFQLPNQGQGHFNQSFFLRVCRPIHKKELRHALEIIIQRHSMLRARFSNTNIDGSWEQRITNDVSSSYRLRTFDLEEPKQATSAIADSQGCLDPHQGPMFAVDLFDVAGEDQLLFMVGHHLVIDLVSWRVILEDLEELLVNPEVATVERPFSFQRWCQLQVEDSKASAIDVVLPIYDFPVPDPSYWGIDLASNTYGNAALASFELDETVTSAIMTRCHDALRTEPVDVLISGLISSFTHTFRDRPAPAIYNEGHGRESSSMGDAVDLSRTVGWFTTMYPVYVSQKDSANLVDTVKHVKDLRRKIPDNGRPYFSSRMLTEEGNQRFSHHWPLEITFNYLGQYQQLERQGALLKPVDALAGETRGAEETSDVGNETPRFGLVEISAVIAQGKLRFSFTYNRHMNHQERLRSWISKCSESLKVLSEELAGAKPRLTTGDFPLLTLTDDSLQSMVQGRFENLGITDLNDVEDAYPCSSMQEGLLISQAKCSSYYAVQVVLELQITEGQSPDPERLLMAWNQVVDRHSCLRTIFIESVSGDDGIFDQVVLKKVIPNITQMDCSSENYALQLLGKKQSATYGDGTKPPHRFTICKTSDGKVFCKLEISHAIMDGSSMSIIVRDLEAAYEGKLRGGGPRYSDYISFLQKQATQRSVGYWKGYLADIEPCMFPILNDGRPMDRNLRSLRLQFNEHDFGQLQRFCSTNNVTLSNAFHTAWAVTLRNYTASADICFGYLISGRDAPIPRIEDAVGPFVNLLVCRVGMDSRSTLNDVLQKVQQDYIDSLPHQSTSLAEVQHSLRLGGTPLFNTALSYRRLPTHTSDDAANVRFQERLPTYDPTEYDVSINIETSDQIAEVDLDYWTDYVSEGQAVNIGTTFLQALKNIVFCADQKIGDLICLHQHHLERISDWNGNCPEVIDDCVHNVIQKQALEHPSAPAVCAWDAELTYDQLDDLSTRLAKLLLKMNIGPETFVPTCFDKSGWTIVAMLAVLKAGGAAVPLDAKHPRSALELRIGDTAARVVLTSPDRAVLFQDMGVEIVSVSRELLDQLVTDAASPQTTVQPTNSCFIIYTSGSTGVPKGVVLEHRAIVTSGNATGSVYKWGSGSRVLQFASYTFDNSLAEIFITLMRGGCVCVPSEHDRLNDLAGVINRMNVNFLDITPTVASFLQPSDVPTVNNVSLGGEPLTKDNIEVWGKAVSLHCCYGPSECSINSTWNGDLENSCEITNIGKSIGSNSWILNPDNQDILMPLGCIGELAIEGPILARGYLNDPDKTAQSFIQNPKWAKGTARRIYKTGDLARYNSDGTITYLGRKDTQVKLNGQRIELGEIEHHIKSILPSDAQSLVELVTRHTATGQSKALAVFFFLKEELSALTTADNILLPMSDQVNDTVGNLQKALSKEVPAYMVPNIYVPVAMLPMTTSGKLDRRRLRSLWQSLSETEVAMYRLSQTSGRAPSTEMETVLAQLWQAALGLQSMTIGPDDNFFKIGGDSIGAMRLITVARMKGISLTVADVFQQPTLSALALNAKTVSSVDAAQYSIYDLKPFKLLPHEVDIAELTEEVASYCQTDIQSITDIYPCTAIQEGLIALSTKDPGAYVAQSIYELPSSVDIDKFRNAWEEVVESEVILQTRIVHTTSNGFLQVVVKEPVHFSQEVDIESVVNQERNLPHHNGGVLSTYATIQEGENWYFVWTAHHAIYDGWSLPLLLDRVEKLYHGSASNSKATNGASYTKFIKYLVDIDPAESDAFWKSRLSGTTATLFPALPNPAYQVHATAIETRSTKIIKHSGSHITLGSTIRAAWALTVGVYSGNPTDVVFGETLTGRDAPVDGIADMIGPTLATIPTRLQIDPALTLSVFLDQVQTHSSAALPFQYAGLQRIKHLSDDNAIACGFQNLLAVHYDDGMESQSNFWKLRSTGTSGTNFYSYPLTVSCQLGDGMVDIEVHFDEDVISQWLIQRILAQFEKFVQLLSSPDRLHETLGNLQMLNAEDHTLIDTWNAGNVSLVDRCVHQMIEEHANTLPQATMAVESWDTSFTYAELDNISTKLANYLLTKNVSGKFIPLCFEKSSWTIIAMLAVLKSGSAFVPLDPAAPISRLKGVISDIDATIILCSPRFQLLCADLASEVIPVDGSTVIFSPKISTLMLEVDSNSPAYVIFTSGTTGKPKGTIIQHNAFCTGAVAHGNAMHIKSSSRVLQFASYTFDASLMEIFTTLILGGCVCVPNDEVRLNNITDFINKMDVSWTLLTPSFVQLFQPSAVPTLSTLVLGGEAMSQGHITTWADKLELINAYGPSECSVVATVNNNISISSDPNNIGHAVGSRAWITDPSNPNRLVPVGSVGELTVEGPILAQGYLNNSAKTVEVFIENPTWTLVHGHSKLEVPRKMYRTGDLVRYTSDGTLLFCGRKDNQAKLHGQRLELDEVEHHLRMDPYIQHVLAVIPKAGFCTKRLVTILSLQELAASHPSSTGIDVVIPEASSFYLSKIRDRLCGLLPNYMIPSNWIVVGNIPLMASGKLDRRQIENWIENMSPEVYQQISEAESKYSDGEGTVIAQQLREIWGAALSLPPSKIGLNQSFIRLGGDSISAMQVMSSCRAEGLGVTMQDIIQSKSISELSSRVTLPEEVTREEEPVNELFDLSPIQRLFFECVGKNHSHFNQSVSVSLARKISLQLLSSSIETITMAHSMLRARFKQNVVGTWQQLVSRDVSSSFKIMEQKVTREEIEPVLRKSQESLNIQDGPLFIVNLFEVENQTRQVLSVVAHHLIVDVVSWRIILQDIENCLARPDTQVASSLPFQTWLRRQQVHAQSLPKNTFYPEDVQVADLDYWSMESKNNVYGDTVEDGFTVDAETSIHLLGACNDSMNTEPVDIFLASILQSFCKAFPERSPLPIFNEGHGREPWESKLDISRTVGWFTTLCPVALPSTHNGTTNLLNTIRWVKDLRCRIPHKGRPYFAYRLLTDEGQERFCGHWPIEATFNYLGKLNQPPVEDAILQSDENELSATFDIGSDVPRFALFEISASVTDGKINFSFSYNKNMDRKAKIRRWVLECKSSLEDAAKMLLQRKQERTLNDFPLLQLSYNGIELLAEKLPQLGLQSLEDIEDVYSCSPTQQGMLLAQLKDPELYAYSMVFEAISKHQEISPRHIAEAWQAVVKRHSALRTVFIRSLSVNSLNDQVVLKDSIARIAWLEGEDARVLDEQKSFNFNDFEPPHRFTVCKTVGNRVFCKLEISHAISDGTSIPILLRDLAAAYTLSMSRIQNPSNGNATTIIKPESPDVGPLYSDYIRHLQSAVAKDDINYWKAYLEGVEPCHINYPADGGAETKELKSVVLKLAQASQLRTFCSGQGVTLSNVLQFTWAMILRAYTGSDDVCFGYLTSGRDAPIRGIQDSAVGAFINMLTCRMNLESTLSLGNALHKIQTDFVNGMIHQNCSLSDVQHELQLSGTALFNTAFTFQNRAGIAVTADENLHFEILNAYDPSEYDVTVNVEASEADVEIHFGYWTSSLSTAQASNVADTFDHIISSIVSQYNAEHTIGDFDLFSSQSRSQVMSWNHSLPEKVDKCLHDIIFHQTTMLGSAAAVCAWDTNLTYTELDALAEKLSIRLVELGVGPEVYVALCFEKSAWNVVSILAVLKAGGAFVPLDHSHPPGRLQNFIDDVKADIVLCSALQFDKVAGTAKNVLIINASSVGDLTGMSKTTVFSEVSPDDAAYLIFTSGTTGRPKATVIEHAAFATSASEHSKAMCMRSNSRVLQFASHTFDASVMEILTTLLVGGCVCIPSEADRMNDIPGAIRRMGVTWTLLTPSVASTLSPKSVPSLKVLVTGGEAMSSGHIAKWKKSCCLINAYGPSETSVIASTSTKVDESGNELNLEPSNIGRAVGGRAWIIDPRNYHNLMPVGSIGELAVEGRIVARGYLNNDKKTFESFITDPMWLKEVSPRERIYRTGDLVRYNPDGTMSFFSRKDTQIKLNGQRIELGEIEHHVKKLLPEDFQSAVELVAPMSRTATKALAVFFYCPSREESDAHQDERITGVEDILLKMTPSLSAVARNLDTALATVLPNYMIPSFYVPVSRMPWMSSGKMDRAKLRNIVQNMPRETTGPYRLADVESNTASSPRTPMEKKLQSLWAAVLNVADASSVGIEDNFFRLGGDSITAMRLVEAARSEGIAIAVINIFRNARLCDMATICDFVKEEISQELVPFSLLKDTQSVESVTHELSEQCRVPAEMILDAYPCSLLQEGLITLSLKQSGAYVLKNVFKLPAHLDLDRFKAAWQEVVQDVDILRTRIVHMQSSAFIQVVLQDRPIEWHTAKTLREIDTAHPKIPEHNGGCLARYTIVSAEDMPESYFVWEIHHALYDGWSLPMVLKRVEMTYMQSASDLTKSSYAGFIQYTSSIDEKVSDNFWRTRLLNASPLQFPQPQHTVTDSTLDHDTLTHKVPISRNTTSMGITLPTIIRAAWSLVVAAYSGSDDVVFGETLAGRDIPVQNITDIIGPTFTTVPTRIQVERSSSVLQFLNEIQKNATDVIPFQHAGLQRIKRLDSDTEIACDFQNLLVVQTAEEAIESSMWDLQGSGVASNFFTYPLVLECGGGSDSVDITAHYDRNCLSSWQVQQILYQMDCVLRQLSDVPRIGLDTKVSTVEVFSPQDRDTVQKWNSSPPQVVDRPIHEVFQDMVLSQPAAPAVCAWDGEFAYEELFRNASVLAHHLAGRGVSRGRFIAICMDKSSWVIVGMLGIMMAGGAFVPLDPGAPSARHHEMIKDVNADIVICTPTYLKRFQDMAATVIPLDEKLLTTSSNLNKHLSKSVSPRARSEDPAYVIFTSGSTGRPKGTLVEHRAISSSSRAMQKALLMKSDARVLQFASFTFDVSVLEILTTLTCGACICIPSEDMRTRNVGEAINTLKATWAFLTPSVANLVEPASVPSLEVLVCGGEPMSIENIQKWASKVTLVNGYGPTEASVIAIANSTVSKQKDPSNIGYALSSGFTWIADPQDYNKLAPVGCVGELLLDGPLLARCYVNNQAKTDEAFVHRPSWATHFDEQRQDLGYFSPTVSSPGRMYRTGDLVRYAQDGSLLFIGRKDDQVKLHGQRIELGEIEHSLDKDTQIQHALVVLPKTGHFRKRLVAVVSLTAVGSSTITQGTCELVEEGQRAKDARKILVSVKDRLSNILPAYMVPTFWPVVESIPLLPSGKLNRRSVERWLSDMDSETFERLIEGDDEEDESVPASDTSKTLQAVFSKVLNLPLNRVKFNKSFLNLGGDSITAMQVMAMCRKHNMSFTLSEVLRSKSIHQLASAARFEGDFQYPEEIYDTLFELSPIQKLYFQTQKHGMFEDDGRFNQSFSLEISRPVAPSALQTAIQHIVQKHSMLRARFVQDSSKNWKQQVMKDAVLSYRYRTFDDMDPNKIPLVVAETQSCLNIRQGPVFAVDLFNTNDSKQVLFLAAHHLVIDMVSWRIILKDLEDLLQQESFTSEKALSFQAWNRMQIENNLDISKSTGKIPVLPFKLPTIDSKYWGIDQSSNGYGDVICETFTTNETIANLALVASNKLLRTQPIELFLSAISHSFTRVFFDRPAPVICNEGHGREPWDSRIDVSRTVGWFTTVTPVFVDIDMEEDDPVETVRRMKDVCRSIPDNGRPYFANQMLSDTNSPGQQSFQSMEIIFNYLGRMQQLEHNDSLLRQWSYTDDEETSKKIADVGSKTTRLALFEVSAAVVDNKIQFSFLFNRRVHHQQQIKRWITECKETFEEIVQKLSTRKEETSFTLSDFPLLPLSYGELQKILTKSLPSVGITPNDVEDIYPCAPLQEGLLISQIKNPSLYHFHAIFEVHPAGNGEPIDAARLGRAWQKIVDRHGALRTVFADSVYKGDIFNQIVVKKADSGLLTLECEEKEAIEKLGQMTILEANYKRQPRLPHQATICRTSRGKVFIKVEVNHAVIDGSSANIMLKDLATAYNNSLETGSGPLYRNYVAYIKNQPLNAGMGFWKGYLGGLNPCYFPKLNSDSATIRKLSSAIVKFDRFAELQDMCKEMKVTLANVMQTAWAFCLRRYTKSRDVCFGYLTSGRDVPVPGVQSTIGAFINMLICRVSFSKDSTIKELFQKVQNDYLQSLEYQYCSLAQVQHELGGGGQPLFNTAVSIQGEAASDRKENNMISFDPVAAHDPSEYVATLNIRTVKGDEGAVIRFWTDTISESEAQKLSDLLAQTMEGFVNDPHQLADEIDTPKSNVALPNTEAAPQEPGTLERPAEIVTNPPQIVASEIQLRDIIAASVRETIEQLLKSGAITARDPQQVGQLTGFTPQEVVQPMMDYSQMTPTRASRPSRPKAFRTTSTATFASVASTARDQLRRVEQKLLSVWSQLLQISEDSIKKDDSFFQLGGDSIIAMQMVGMARDEDLDLTVANIFRHPTFSEMAVVIKSAEENDAAPAILDTKEEIEARESRIRAKQNALYQRYSLVEAANVDAFLQENICSKVKSFRGGITDVFPVTDFQALAVTGTLMESKWMLNYFYLEGTGSLDLRRIKSAISQVVNAFEILRTVFVPYGNRFFQVVLRKLDPGFEVHEADNLAEFTLALQQKDRDNGPRPGEPYLKFSIVKQRDSALHRIIMRISHAQYDGVCLPTILTALQTGYMGQKIPSAPSFSNYIRDAVQGTADHHYVYWKDFLKGSSMTEVVRRNNPNYRRGTDAPTTLKRILRINSLASENVTPATVIKAAWSLVLAQWSAQTDIVFGNVISGRNADVLGVENIVGPCVNLVPVRIQFQHRWSVLDLLQSIQTQQVAAMPYESLGFREIIKHCTDWPDWANFSTVCQHQNIQRETQIQLGRNDYTLGAVGSQEDFADLTVLSTPQENDDIEISLTYTSTSGITDSFASEMFEALCKTTMGFSVNPRAMLPSPTELSLVQRKTLDIAETILDLQLSKDALELSRDEQSLYTEILTTAWNEILSNQNDQPAMIDLNSSFYDLGGDIIGLAQVSSLLEEQNLRLRVEDLVDHPVMMDQLTLLAAQRRKTKELEIEEIQGEVIKEPSVRGSKKGIKKLLGKSVRFAMRKAPRM